jgi:prepilin-type N-terminal cleavage/methylation domain-containing protein
MKSEFKTKLIQHLLNKKNGEKGFTLIELLVVIIIIGILAAIALPSFLNQANKARESEAKTYTGSVNRGQQAYFLEQRQFTGGINFLGLGLNTATANYNYVASLGSQGNAAGPSTTSETVRSNINSYINIYGRPITAAVKGFAGTTYVNATTGGEQTTVAVLCGSKQANATVPTATPVVGYASNPGLSITACNGTDMENLDK